MVKEKEPKERLLRKLIPKLRIADGALSSDAGEGWETITATTGSDPVDWAVWRGYFDLSGIVEQQETLFTVGPVFQEADDFTYITSKPQGSFRIWDMITQEYLTDDTFNNILAGSGGWIAPGMQGSGNTPAGAAYELQDVHYGNFRNFQYGPMTSFGVSQYFPIQTRSVSWGVGAATAGQKLYITRAIPMTTGWAQASLNEGTAPAAAVVVPCLILKETDLRYIERLRRSYVIQPTVD